MYEISPMSFVPGSKDNLRMFHVCILEMYKMPILFLRETFERLVYHNIKYNYKVMTLKIMIQLCCFFDSLK